jgi:hypothetical protein
MKSYIMFIVSSWCLILNIRLEFFLGGTVSEKRGMYDIGVSGPTMPKPFPTPVGSIPIGSKPVEPEPVIPKDPVVIVPKPVIPKDPNLAPIVPKPVKSMDINTSDSIREKITDLYDQGDLFNQVDFLDVIQISCII